MDPNSPTFQKLLRSNLNDEFGDIVDDWLEKEHDGFKVSQKIIQSKKMKKFMKSTKNAYKDQQQQGGTQTIPSVNRPQTSLSFIENELFEDDWSGKGNSDTLNDILNDISSDKPDHVQLAGYEILFKYDLANLICTDSWELFLSSLRDAICDGSRPVFEASLQMHTKMLGFPFTLHEKSTEVFVNLINAYENVHQSRKFNDIMPTTITGINFKILLHEKLCRIMHLLVRHQEEVLKSARNVDKTMEEMIEHFLRFLSLTTSQTKTFNALNILSVLEPQAEWSKKWNHGFLTRRVFCQTLAKVPSLLQRTVVHVNKYLEQPPITIPVSIIDDINETYISGDSVEALTYLHCLTFLAQLYGHSTGRTLLFEQLTDNCVSVNEFLINLLNSLNVSIISEVANSVYETMHKSLLYVLDQPIPLCDARFYAAALNPLMRDSDNKIWPHVMDVLMYMLETTDGRTFLVTEYKSKSANAHKRDIKFPAESILFYASGLLKQPLSVINIEHLKDLFKIIEKMFTITDIYNVVKKIFQEQFLPALKYFYSNVDKYFVENENKTQKFNKAARSMLLKASTIPLILKSIVNESSILRELVLESVAPLRTYWNVNNVAAFISNAAFFSSGFDIIQNLAPYMLSTFIIEICKISEEPMSFHDPWVNPNVNTFQHTLSLFSLNTKCFVALMLKENSDEEKHDYPASLYELYQYCLNPDSSYHYISLLSVKSTIWNLDIFIYLLNLLNFQDEFLKMQENCIIEIEEDGEIKEKYIVDECSIMRHIILTDSYRMEHKIRDYDYNPEDYHLFSKMPSYDGPNQKELNSNPKTEFDELLEDDRPGLRDSSWVSEARRAFRNSEHAIMNNSVYNLVNQMQEAIPTVDWIENFKWNTAESNAIENYWLPEEIIGFDISINYAQLNKISLLETESQHLLKIFMKSTYDYIKYDKANYFEHFDWFLATVFIICKGDVDKCKTFMFHFIKFPSAMFIWPTFGKIIDKSNAEESTTHLLFAQLLENIVDNEFPSFSNALKQNCGCSWWMICDRLISQCFWGILPWNEILNYLVICILYPPDYILYYCTSLLNHCQHFLIQNVTNGKLWPENLVLYDYKCHAQIGFMDQLGKRYRGKILPILSQQKLKIAEQTQ